MGHAVLFGFNAVVFLGEVRLAVLRGTLALCRAIITPNVCRHLALRLRHPLRPPGHPQRPPRHPQRPRQVAHAVLFGFNAVVFLGEVRHAVWKGAFALGKATTTPSVCQHRVIEASSRSGTWRIVWASTACYRGRGRPVGLHVVLFHRAPVSAWRKLIDTYRWRI